MARRGLVILLVSASMAVGQAAWAAATIGPIEATRIRRSKPPKRSTNTLAISQSDCLAGDEFTFPLQISYTSGETLEVWVGYGVDCTQGAARGLSGLAPTCGLVYSSSNPTAPTATITLSDAELITAAAHPGRDQPTPSCEPPSTASPGLQPLSIYFIFQSAGGTQVTAQQTVTFIQFAMTGPKAPTNVRSGVGDTMLKVSWNQNTDSTIAGYYVFCDPPPGPLTSVGASFSSLGPTPDQLGTVRLAQVGGDETDAAPFVGEAGSAVEAGASPGAAMDEAGVDAGAVTAEAGADAGAVTAEAGADAGAATEEAGAATDDAGSEPGGPSGPGTDEPNGDSGTDDDGGSGGATSTCTSVLVAGGSAAEAIANGYLCGQANGYSASSNNVENLVNGYTYSVAVASFDTLGNVGSLSAPYCVPGNTTPGPIYGFYESYQASGGTAGGSSFCSVRASGPRSSDGIVSAGLIGLALAGSLARRTRRRGSSS